MTNTKKNAKNAETAKKTTKKVAEEVAVEKSAATVSDVSAIPGDKTELEQLKEENVELKRMLNEIIQNQQNQPQIVVTTPETEKVQFLWMADVADENHVQFGENGFYGQITGKTGSFSVPKNELSRILTGMVRLFLDKRWLIVVSGLTDEERQQYGVDYKDGEVMDRKVFDKMVELGDEILDIYPKLCDGHKDMVARSFNEAFLEKKHGLKREIVYQLYEIAKGLGRGKDFANIVNGLSPAAAEKE